MDHLPLPRSTHAAPPRVPYVCAGDDPYDGADFATYPYRADWPQLLTAHTGVPIWITCRQSNLDAKQMTDQAKILQAWVFFGLLHQMLSPFRLYAATDYIERDEDGGRSWVHTKELEPALSAWRRGMSEYDSQALHMYIEDAKRSLILAQEVLIALNTDTYKQFDRTIKMSFATMCSLVQGMINAWNEVDHPAPKLWTSVQLDDVAREGMLHNGWCPSDIIRTTSRGGASVSGTWFAQHIVRDKLGESHIDCSDESCERLQIKEAQYRPRHVEQTCTCCEDTGPNAAEIIACLKDGSIPVLEVIGNQGEHPSIKVHRQELLDADTAYVAISHVWADGLGNPKEMTLPSCQIQRLGELVQAIKSHTFYRGKVGFEEAIIHKKRLFLWCDTLCCPIDMEYKVIALDRMRDVYEKAEFTLILDRELQCYSYSDIGVLEAGWRVINSRWMRRLWTYQEAGLALRLLVQFNDIPVSLYPLMQTLRQMYTESPRRELLYNQISAEMVLLRLWHEEVDKPWISRAVMGIAHRDVSVPSDEPLCIATVLGLNNKQITRAPPDQRMQTLWRVICQHERSVRESVIFNTVGRLRTPGFRWAPASFLQPLKYLLDHISLDDDGTNKAVLLTHGIRVQFAGWRIRLAPTPKGLGDDFLPSWSSQHQIVPAIHADGARYSIRKIAHDGIPGPQDSILHLLCDTSREWFLVLSRQGKFVWEQWTSQQKAVLVSKELHPSGLWYYRSHMIVHVDRTIPRFELRERVVHIYSETLRKSWTMFAIGLLWRVRNILEVVSTWNRSRVGGSILAWSSSVLARRHEWYRKRLIVMMVTVDKQALKQPYAAKLWREGGGKDDTESLRGHIIAPFMGRFVNIEQVYEQSTEWVID